MKATEPKPHEPKPQAFERVIGGDGSELTIVCEPAQDGQPAVCHVEERPPYYASNDDLPDEVRSGLPPEAQTLYRQTFNSAWAQHVMPVKRGLTARHSDAARRSAWAAVKRLYARRGDAWIIRNH